MRIQVAVGRPVAKKTPMRAAARSETLPSPSTPTTPTNRCYAGAQDDHTPKSLDFNNFILPENEVRGEGEREREKKEQEIMSKVRSSVQIVSFLLSPLLPTGREAGRSINRSSSASPQ